MKQDAIALVKDLVALSTADTACRDLYLHRARKLLANTFPEESYLAACDADARIDAALRQARDAIARKDWSQAKEASDRAATLERNAETAAANVAAVGPLYTAPPVVPDQFSASLRRALRDAKSPTALRDDAGRVLTALEKNDPEWKTLYAARRSAVAAFPLPTDVRESRAKSSVALEAEAMQAAERGDVAQLDKILASIVESGKKAEAEGSKPEDRPLLHIDYPAALSEPFPADPVRQAATMGLEQAEIRPSSEEAANAIADFLARNAGSASLTAASAPRNGVIDLSKSFESIDAGGRFTDTMAETIALFAWQIFINSAGLRYVPLSPSREFVLVESFAEGEDSASPLLEALGLERRRGLSRRAIEDALVCHGPEVVQKIGLDPFAFRLVCIPPDVFVRVGATRDWGKKPEWTHLDGYRVLSDGKLLALVGGNSEFGGLADLCGISPGDERQNVIARFAVVRRERLASRLV